MRNGMVWVAVIAFAAATGWAQESRSKDSQAETLVRWHFAGLDALKQLKSQKALQDVLGLGESTALRDAALVGFSRQAAARFGKNGSTEAQQKSAALIQQLLPDVLRYESKFQMSATGESDADWALALNLPAAREGEWKKTLTDLARNAGLTVNEGEKWSATHDKYQVELWNEKNWTLLRGGYSAPEKQTKWFSDFRKALGKSAGKQVLSADLNLPQLGRLWKAERLSHAPRLIVTAEPNRDGIRSEVDLDYPRSLGIKPEKWEVPVELIRDPLVGFTAIQGVREALEASPVLKSLGLQQTPNQLFTWSIGDSPFSIYLAGNVGNASAVVTNLFQHLTTLTAAAPPGVIPGRAQAVTNGNGFIWQGWPVAVPFVEVGNPPKSKYLVAGLFPVQQQRTNQAPAELFEQLKKKNQIYYEWEITQERLKQWRPTWQLLQIVTSKQLLRSDAPSESWLEAIAPYLGNSVTEASLQGDHRIHVVRQSHLGFNAIELVLLAHWLDPLDFRPAPTGAGTRGSPAPRNRPSPNNPSSGNAETRR